MTRCRRLRAGGAAVLALLCAAATGTAQDLGTYPDWTAYALTDALFLGRDNQASSRPLVLSTTTNAPLLSANDPQFPVAPGVRAFYGRRQPEEGGWELGYFGVYGQSAARSVAATPPGYLQAPNPLGPLFTADGETATLTSSSLINSAEANLFRTRTEWRDPSSAWLTVDWLAGFRYVGVEESASLVINCCESGGTLTPVSYDVSTRNNMFGGQLGGRARWTWERWAFEGWAKAGLLGNAQEQIQAPIVDYIPSDLRPGRSSWGSSVGFIGDINTSVVYRLTDVWGIRAGYNLIWIDGLALAADQFDFTQNATSGTHLVSGGGIFLHGANLGLEARW